MQIESPPTEKRYEKPEDERRERPRDVHVCLTGRRCPPEIIELADTVTEMSLVKHAFQAGVPAQRGIED